MSLRSNATRKSSQRQSRVGFSPLPNESANMQSGDAAIDIPLDEMQGATSPNGMNRQNSSTPFAFAGSSPLAKVSTADGERRHTFGGRRVKRDGSNGSTTVVDRNGEAAVLTKMGKVYKKITEFSTLTRYMVYVTPLAAIIAIPLVVGATVAQDAKIGGVRICWFFVWIEIGEFVPSNKLRLRLVADMAPLQSG